MWTQTTCFTSYVRARNGKFRKFDARALAQAPVKGSRHHPEWYPAGAVTGSYVDANGAYHGFLVTWASFRFALIQEFERHFRDADLN